MPAERIRIDADVSEILIALTDSDNGHSVFQYLYQALILAACLGRLEKQFAPITKVADRPDPIKINLFDDNIINILALAHTDDPSILAPDRLSDRNEIFEGYATGGLGYLRGMAGEDNDYLGIITRLISDRNPSATGTEDLTDEISHLADIR